MKRVLTNWQEQNLKDLSEKVNRSYAQEVFLFELCDYDARKLKLLEVQLKNTFFMGCPSDKECVEHVLNLPVKSNWFTL